jgi:hypothetical protein
MDLRIALAFAATSLLVGCGAHHVTLNAPPRTAPLAERQQAYEDLRLEELKTVSHTSYVDASGKTRESHSTVWTLGNRKEIENPEDLLQVVDPRSETATHLNGYLHASDKHATLGTVTLVTLLGGVALLATGALLENTTVGAVGGVAVLASPVLYITYHFQVRGTKSRHLSKVPDIYNRDLRAHLGIEHTEEFVDTEATDAAVPAADTSSEFIDSNAVTK